MAAASRRLHAVGSRPAAVDARHHRARRGAPARRRPRLGVRRPRHLRPLPGRARRRARSPSGGSTVDADALDRPAPIELDYQRATGRCSARSSARLRGADLRRRRDRRAGREPGAPPGGPQGPRPRPTRDRSARSRCSTSRCRRPARRRRSRVSDLRIADADAARALPDVDGRELPTSPRRCSRRWQRGGHRPRPRVTDRRATATAVDRRRLAGLRRRASTASRSTSARPRSPATCATSSTGEVLASPGRMNPQIRFGEDLMSRVSYVMMNPGGERQLTAARPRRARRADRRAVRRGRRRPPTSVLEIVLVGNPIMHHIVARHRPDAARAGAVHARHRPRRSIGRRATSSSTCPTRRVLPRRRASPATSAPTRPRRILAEGPHRGDDDAAARRRRHERRDRARRPRRASSPRRAPPGRRSRAPRSAAGSAPRRVPSSACASTATRSSRVQGDRLRPVERRTRLRRAAAERRRSPASAARASSRSIAEMFLAGVIDTDGVDPRRDGRHGRRASSPTAARSRYVLHDDRRHAELVDHAERRARDPARQGRAARRHRPADRARRHRRRSTDIRLAGAFGAHIDPVYALVLGLVPDCPVERRAFGRQRGRRRRRAGAAVDGRRGPRWKPRCAGVIKIETATEPRFQELFVAAMAFPHATAPSPNLAPSSTLPAAIRRQPRRRRRRGRRSAAGPDERGHDDVPNDVMRATCHERTGRAPRWRAGRPPGTARGSHVVEPRAVPDAHA